MFAQQDWRTLQGWYSKLQKWYKEFWYDVHIVKLKLQAGTSPQFRWLGAEGLFLKQFFVFFLRLLLVILHHFTLVEGISAHVRGMIDLLIYLDTYTITANSPVNSLHPFTLSSTPIHMFLPHTINFGGRKNTSAYFIISFSPYAYKEICLERFPPPQKKKMGKNQHYLGHPPCFFWWIFKIRIPKKTCDVGTFEAVQEVQMESQSWYAKASAVVEVRGGEVGNPKRAGMILQLFKGDMILYDGWMCDGSIWKQPKTTVYVQNVEIWRHDETKGGSHPIYIIYISFCMPFCLLFLTPTAHWPVVCPQKLLWNSNWISWWFNFPSSFYWHISYLIFFQPDLLL